MVNANVRRSADAVADIFSDMEIGAVAAIAVLGAGGFVLAQEWVDLTFPLLDLNPDPTTPGGLGLSALAKLVGVVVLVGASHRFGGTTIATLAGILAFGMASSAGADLFDVLQRGGIPGLSPGGQSRSTGRATPNVQRVERASPSSSPSPPTPQSASSGSAGGSSTTIGAIDNGAYR